MLTASHSKWTQLLSCCPWPRKNVMVAGRGLFRGMRKRKGSPHPSGCWQASLVWQPEKTGELRGLQISHLTPIPFRLERGKRGWLPAEGWLLVVSFSYMAPAKMSFMRCWECSGGPCPLLLCCSGALPLTPSIWYFLISEKQVESWAAAELCVRGLLSCSSLFFAGCVWPLRVQRKIGNLAVSIYPA